MNFSHLPAGHFYGVLDTAAHLWNLHADNGRAFDVVVTDDFGQLFGVVDAVKLWTSDQSYFTMDKVLMEAAVRKRYSRQRSKVWHRRNTGRGSGLI